MNTSLILRNVKLLHLKLQKKMLTEITEYLNKSRYILCSWIRRFNIVKMLIFPKLICRFDAIPLKVPKGFSFVNIIKQTLKFILKCKGLSQNDIGKEKKNNIIEGFILHDFKKVYKDTAIKIVWLAQ